MLNIFSNSVLVSVGCVELSELGSNCVHIALLAGGSILIAASGEDFSLVLKGQCSDISNCVHTTLLAEGSILIAAS